ncbi:hypothetical protein [Bacteroides sp.]|uniref:hypothetical protein n=1 Tax=Bacteroides sp. TaxID=29523 RepID=UPI0026121451|nr:hypothetical protein [Bacteroides sp.]
MINFENQIATTREQSEKLLSLGVLPETADMVYHHTKSKTAALEWELKPYPPTLRSTTKLNIARLASSLHKHPDGTTMTGEEVFDEIWGKDVPAWSLSRLIDMMPSEITIDRTVGGLFISHIDISYFGFNSDKTISFLTGFSIGANETIFDICIDMIDWLIKNRHFNKEYLK